MTRVAPGPSVCRSGRVEARPHPARPARPRGLRRRLDGKPEEERLGPLQLVEALREGGHVVYLRHAATDRSSEDDPAVDLRDCATQRNLSDAGPSGARAIGAAFRRLEIPSVASPRASTAGRARRPSSPSAARGRARPDRLPEGERSRPTRSACARTSELLGRRPAEGENTVLVAHVKNIEESAARSIEEGELAVFEPLGGGELPLPRADPREPLARPRRAGRPLDPAGRAAVLHQVLLVVLLRRPERRRRHDLGRDRPCKRACAPPSTRPRPPPARASG